MNDAMSRCGAIVVALVALVGCDDLGAQSVVESETVARPIELPTKPTTIYGYCTQNSDCDDGNPCTTDYCTGAKSCSILVAPNCNQPAPPIETRVRTLGHPRPRFANGYDAVYLSNTYNNDAKLRVTAAFEAMLDAD